MMMMMMMMMMPFMQTKKQWSNALGEYPSPQFFQAKMWQATSPFKKKGAERAHDLPSNTSPPFLAKKTTAH